MIPRPILALAAVAAFFAPALSSYAQVFTLPSGNQVLPLLTSSPNTEIGGFDLDAAGDIFYLQQDQSSLDTQLMEQPKGGSPVALTDLGAVFGSFVRIQGNQIYVSYAPGSDSTLLVGTIGQPVQTWQSFDTHTSAYDLAFNASGTAFLSADPTGFTPGNFIYQVGIAGGNLTLTKAVSVPNDNSGPIAFDPSGNLLYGATGSNSPAGGIYRISQSSLATALSSSQVITLDSSFLLQSDIPNEYFADGGGGLFQDSFSSSNLLKFDSNGEDAPTVYGSTGSGMGLGNLAFENGQLYVNVTDFVNDVSYLVAVPEPGSVSLLLAGSLLLLHRRRRV